MTIPRDNAFQIIQDHIQNESLVRHCLAVEIAMKGLARHFGENEQLWGVIGLLHDADWEETENNPQMHTRKTIQWLHDNALSDDVVERAILSHNYENNNEPAPQNNLEWSLYCCDELTGLITATALMRPDKKLKSVEVKSVLKKFKTKSFATGVDREKIKLCEEKLSIPFENFVQLVLDTMKREGNIIGL